MTEKPTTNCKSIQLNDSGYTLAAALTIIAIFSILMAASVPLWSKVKQRENEQELIFRGQEYIEAIGRYHQKFGTYPPDLDTLEKLKFIRKLYKDPMTKSGKWKVLHPDSLVQTGAAGAVTGGQLMTGGQRGILPGTAGGKDAQQDDDDDDDDGLFGPGLKDDDDEEEEEEEEEGELISRGPVVGVMSRSKKKSFKLINGQDRYNKWIFVFALQQQQQQQQRPPGQKGTVPGQPGQPSRAPGQPPRVPGQPGLGSSGQPGLQPFPNPSTSSPPAGQARPSPGSVSPPPNQNPASSTNPQVPWTQEPPLIDDDDFDDDDDDDDDE